MPLFIFTILNLFLHVATLKLTCFFVAENEQILVTEDDFPEVKVDFQAITVQLAAVDFLHLDQMLQVLPLMVQ